MPDPSGRRYATTSNIRKPGEIYRILKICIPSPKPTQGKTTNSPNGLSHKLPSQVHRTPERCLLFVSRQPRVTRNHGPRNSVQVYVPERKMCTQGRRQRKGCPRLPWLRAPSCFVSWARYLILYYTILYYIILYYIILYYIRLD